MPRLRYAAKARADISVITEYIAKDNPPAAGRVLASIRGACRSLADRPGLGRKRPELSADLYSFPMGSYVIFYRVSTEVEILSVLHGARDIPKLIGEGTD